MGVVLRDEFHRHFCTSDYIICRLVGEDGELVRLDTSSLCGLRWIYIRLWPWVNCLFGLHYMLYVLGKRRVETEMSIKPRSISIATTYRRVFLQQTKSEIPPWPYTLPLISETTWNQFCWENYTFSDLFNLCNLWSLAVCKYRGDRMISDSVLGPNLLIISFSPFACMNFLGYNLLLLF